MTKGLKDPVTGRVYIFKGLVPTKSITEPCKSDAHDSCWSVPQELADRQGIEFAKRHACLCPCHGLYEEESE